MARSGAELTPEMLFDRCRDKIRIHNFWTRDAVVLSLISLYRVDVNEGLHDDHPGTTSRFSEFDVRPKPPVPGIIDEDAVQCLKHVTKLLNGVKPALVCKIIKMVAIWCEVPLYQRKIPMPTIVVPGVEESVLPYQPISDDQKGEADLHEDDDAFAAIFGKEAPLDALTPVSAAAPVAEPEPEQEEESDPFRGVGEPVKTHSETDLFAGVI